MLHSAFLTIIILISPLPVQDRPSNTTGDREFYLIGTAHHMHFEDRYHYSVSDLETQVRSLQPDVVCGEITPQALNGPTEGNFPPEAAMLAEMAPRWGAHFVPADWRVSLAWQQRGERQEAGNKSKAEVEAAQNKVKAYYEGFPGGTLYDYTNASAQYLKMIDNMFEEVIGENTPSDIAAGAWHERNRMIVDNCLVGAGQARRVVFVFGSAHLPQLQRQLAARNLRGQIPPRAYTPVGLGAVSSEVIARWERNLKNLENIANGSVAVSADDRAKVIDTNRAPELRNEIALYLAREKTR